jgi:hypothetical protein
MLLRFLFWLISDSKPRSKGGDDPGFIIVLFIVLLLLSQCHG